MNHSNENRYVTLSQAHPLSNGFMYDGEDTSLRREVILITADYNKENPDDNYLRQLRKASTLVNNGFLHILDTIFKERSVMIVLQRKPGKPLIQELNKTHWPFSRVVSLVANLGVAMLDAMEEQINGYSVSADNLWLNEDDRLSVIHYWQDGQSQTQGALGLCGLMLQLFTASTEPLGPYELIDTHFERIEIPGATFEQKEALIKLVRRISSGHASLSTLVFGLKDLPTSESEQASHIISAIPTIHPTALSRTRSRNITEVQPAGPAANSHAEPEVQATNSSNKKVIIGGSAALIAALMIWILWPQSQSEVTVPTATPEPSKSVQVSTPSPTPEPSPSPSPTTLEVRYAKDGEEIDMPNLYGMKQVDAEKEALASRLRYEYKLEANPATAGTVFKQEPEAGAKVMTGDTIKFWVSKSSQ
jgi:hypothetical protein